MTENVRTWLTDDVVALGELARAFFAEHAVPRQRAWARQGHVDRALWRRAGELGLLGASVPERHGGGGGTLAHDLVVFQEQVRVGEHGFGNSMHSGVVAHYLDAFGTPEQKARWLPGMCAGELVGALALTEPDAGSDLRALRTTATREGEHYRVNGGKTFITNGLHADLVVTAVRTAPDAGPRGVSLLVVETGTTPGFARGAPLAKIGQHSADTVPLYFTDAHVPAANLLGREGGGLPMLLRHLPRERLIIAAEAVAGMRRALELTLAHAREHRVAGAPLAEEQHVRFELARCATETRVAETFLDDCVARALRGDLDATTAAMAKSWCTDAAGRVVDRCLQLHGEHGYGTDAPIARMHADLRVQRIYGGSNEVMLELIASSLGQGPAAPQGGRRPGA